MKNPFKFIGGRLALDFANTVDFHARPEPGERLTSYDMLVTWGEQAGIVDPDDGRGLRERAASRPADAGRMLQRAIELRETLYRLFSGLAEGRRPGAELDALNARIGAALAHARMVFRAGTFSWGWDEGADALEALLFPVVRSAADLLTAPELSRVRQCASADGCGWLFLDTSRNGTRRWCDMAECGNRHKVRSYRNRRSAI